MAVFPTKSQIIENATLWATCAVLVLPDCIRVNNLLLPKGDLSRALTPEEYSQLTEEEKAERTVKLILFPRPLNK